MGNHSLHGSCGNPQSLLCQDMDYKCMHLIAFASIGRDSIYSYFVCIFLNIPKKPIDAYTKQNMHIFY